MNPFAGVLRDGTEIAGLFIGLAALGLVITQSQGSATVATAVSQGFSGVLSTATFQRSQVGNVFNSF